MEDDRCWLLTMLVEGQGVQSDLTHLFCALRISGALELTPSYLHPAITLCFHR